MGEEKQPQQEDSPKKKSDAEAGEDAKVERVAEEESGGALPDKDSKES